MEILFSHIKNSGLPWDYANAVYEILPELLEDTEFNPRIVAMAVAMEDLYRTGRAEGGCGDFISFLQQLEPRGKDEGDAGGFIFQR